MFLKNIQNYYANKNIICFMIVDQINTLARFYKTYNLAKARKI